MQIFLIRFLPFLCFTFCITSCENKVQNGEVHEEPLDTNRLVKIELATWLDEPMEMAITNEGNIVFVERKGAIKMYLPAENRVKQIASLPVHTGHEDGLIGITLDPQYEKNNFVYFYYSPAGEKPIQRVSRFVLQKDNLQLTSEKVIIEIPVQRQECCHSAGSLAFAPDGNLFIAVGDNTNPHNPGYYNSIDERKGREHWDAQRTAGNTNDFRGKILRIHPEPDGSYTIPEGNLFPKGTAGTKPEIYVMGCRNPFRIAVDMKKGWLYWGDVGQNTIDDPKRGPISWDEWNVAKEAGFFGWPYFAGPNGAYADFDFETEKIGPFFNADKPENISVNNTGLKILPKAREALIWYSYDESKLFSHLGTGGKSPIGGPVFYTDLYKERINDTTKHLHAHYNKKVFIAEWIRDWINVLTINEDGKLDSIETFMSGTKFSHPVDLEIGPDGALYVLEYGANWFTRNKDAGLYRIEYHRGNRTPVTKLEADKTAGAIPLTVHFSSKGSYDPDSSQLDYKWYFDKKEVQSENAEATYTFTAPGIYPVKLSVSDKEGKVQERTIQVRAGNEEPEIVFNVTKGNKSFYWENSPIEYSINIIDKEDGSLQTGVIPAKDVKLTLAYSTMGTDLAMVAQDHQTITTTEPDFQLIRNSDCKACHAMDEKSVGPSYMSIADRYKNDSSTIKNLAAKIISGGGGVWGEHAMSAHPQLSQEQAKEIASFILSLKNDATLARSIPPSGKMIPDRQKKDQPPGDYIISVSYKDKEQPGAGSNMISKNFYIRNPRVKAVSSDDENGVAKTDGLVSFTEEGSWILFRNIDLTNIRSVMWELDSVQVGGKLSMYLDKPDGKEISSILVEQKSGEKKYKKKSPAKLLPTTGVHDVYIVYQEPLNGKKNISSTLFLEWISFNR
jgi:cytochrome c